MKYNDIRWLCVSAFVLVQACKPDQVGFLNDHMRYDVAELQVVQGTTVSTTPMIANGSTTPMEVELLEIRNKATGQPVPEFLVPKEVSVYLAQVGPDDNTLEQLSAKIGKESYPPIAVNHIGGKVTFSPATEDVLPGNYTIDLQVKNVAGTKVIKEALDINLISMKPDSVFAATCNTSKVGADGETTDLSDFDVTVEHVDNGEDKVILMWMDMEGNSYNPQDGEVIKRANLPSFADWSPYYAEELTDTAIVYPYPYYKGLVYPYKTSVNVGGSSFENPPISHYRLVADVSDIRMNINTSTTARFYKQGTHIVKFRLNTVKRTGYPEWKESTVTNTVELPVGDGYAATPVALDGSQLAGIFGVPVSDLEDLLESASVTFYAIEADGVRNPNSTAAAPGHWFSAAGNVVNWGDDARIYSEFKSADMAFNLGQLPGQTAVGGMYTVTQAFVYDKVSTNERIQVNYVFRIKIVE